MPIPARHTSAERHGIDPHLDEALRCVIAIGALLVLLLPAARGSHAVIGWLPLWLLVMPATAWWALHRFPMPHRRGERSACAPVTQTRRRVPVQARRRTRTPLPLRLPRAA